MLNPQTREIADLLIVLVINGVMLVDLPPVKTWLNQKGFQETSGPMKLVSHLPLDHPSVPHHLNLELELLVLHKEHQPLGHQHLDQLDLVLKTSIRRLRFK